MQLPCTKITELPHLQLSEVDTWEIQDHFSDKSHPRSISK